MMCLLKNHFLINICLFQEIKATRKGVTGSHTYYYGKFTFSNCNKVLPISWHLK